MVRLTRPLQAPTWGSPVEIETKRRIVVAVAAYTYEICSESLLSDADYDSECRQVDLSIDTTNPAMDAWFRKNFQPWTGMWVHRHPDKAGLHRIARMFIPDRLPPLPDRER